MIIYNSISSKIDNHNSTNKSSSKSKLNRIAKKDFKVKPTARSNIKPKLTKKNQIYLESIGLKLKKSNHAEYLKYKKCASER